MKNKRYRFFQVFWVVLAVYLFFGALGLIAASITSTSSPTHYEKLLTWRTLLSFLFGLAYMTVFYYVTCNIFYRLIADKKGTIHYIKIIVLAALALGVYFTVYYLIADKKLSNETPGLLVFSFSISSLFQLCISVLIPYLTYLRDERKQRKILEAQKLQLEVEKSQANFNFLKAQINPHFLHNTLNFLYAKALPLSAELSEGILTLSDIMRYALSEGNARDGRAPLKDEIEHVQNVIKIQQLRFDNRLNVNFNVSGNVEGRFIIPFVLITLVENAFKHGDLKDLEHPIDIRVEVKELRLYFYCRNKKKTGPKELSTGVGLDNIKKRLELAYGNNHKFTVHDEDGFYITELEITSV